MWPISIRLSLRIMGKAEPMGLVNTYDFYKKAFESFYAIGGFQVYNMEMIQGTVEAAASMKSPILLQASCRGVRYAGARTLYQIARIAAEYWNIPVVLHLDHGDSVELCKDAIDAGFTSVMLDCTGQPLNTQIEMTREVVEYAHRHNVTVEGEAARKADCEECYLTSPEEAEAFVNATGCDSLSICVGNSHVLYGRGFPDSRKPALRLGLLAEIHSAVPNTPLVLHSISVGTKELTRRLEAAGGRQKTYGVFLTEELHEAMKLGVVKCNVGTNKISTTVGVREYLMRCPQEMDPRKYYGEGRRIMTEAVKYQIETLFLSAGQLD